MSTPEQLQAEKEKNIKVMKNIQEILKAGGGACTTSGVAATLADVLLASAKWSNTYLGICVGFSFEESVQDVVIRKELSTSPDARAPIARDLVCTVSFLVGPPVDPVVNGCTPGTLVILTQEADCTTCRTHTLTGMVPRGYVKAFNRDTPPAVWTQTFVFQGSLDTADAVVIT